MGEEERLTHLICHPKIISQRKNKRCTKKSCGMIECMDESTIDNDREEPMRMGTLWTHATRNLTR